MPQIEALRPAGLAENHIPLSAHSESVKATPCAVLAKVWPVGILPAGFEEPWLKQHCHKILLVEGGPDYLAVCQLIAEQDENVFPVAMLGASQNICEDALPHFANRRVTIVGHPDEAGRAAAARWAGQIQRAGGLVRTIQPKKGDLCDIVSAGATHNDLRVF